MARTPIGTATPMAIFVLVLMSDFDATTLGSGVFVFVLMGEDVPDVCDAGSCTGGVEVEDVEVEVVEVTADVVGRGCPSVIVDDLAEDVVVG